MLSVSSADPSSSSFTDGKNAYACSNVPYLHEASEVQSVVRGRLENALILEEVFNLFFGYMVLDVG